MSPKRVSVRKKDSAGDRVEDRTEPATEPRGDSDGRAEPVTERRTEVDTPREPVLTHIDRARGGVSLWSILSGTLVAFGAFVVIAAIVGSILAGTGITERGINPEDVRAAGIGSAIGLIIAQFLAYLWGGYTAGRMARGSGALNGVLVALTGIVLVIILGSVVAAVGPEAGVQAPDPQTFPLPLNEMQDIATGAGIGLLVAMFLGAALGGRMGARWHTRLEDTDLASRVR